MKIVVELPEPYLGQTHVQFERIEVAAAVKLFGHYGVIEDGEFVREPDARPYSFVLPTEVEDGLGDMVADLLEGWLEEHLEDVAPQKLRKQQRDQEKARMQELIDSIRRDRLEEEVDHGEGGDGESGGLEDSEGSESGEFGDEGEGGAEAR